MIVAMQTFPIVVFLGPHHEPIIGVVPSNKIDKINEYYLLIEWKDLNT